MRKLPFFTAFFLFVGQILAQNTLHGLALDRAGQPVESVSVSIKNGPTVVSNERGQLNLPLAAAKPLHDAYILTVEKTGWEVLNEGFLFVPVSQKNADSFCLRVVKTSELEAEIEAQTALRKAFVEQNRLEKCETDSSSNRSKLKKDAALISNFSEMTARLLFKMDLENASPFFKEALILVKKRSIFSRKYVFGTQNT